MNAYVNKQRAQQSDRVTVHADRERRQGAALHLQDNRPGAALIGVAQALADNRPRAQGPLQFASVAKRNNTGLPDTLKSGVEALSGWSLDSVKVHYNSSRPAQLNAYAFVQGTNIHVASGQERHLPHEAWHVVQQAQGRVKPTAQLQATPVNDDPALEREADLMGARAARQFGSEACAPGGKTFERDPRHDAPEGLIIQPKLILPLHMYGAAEQGVVQLIGNRSATGPLNYPGQYAFGWVADIADMLAHGAVYDGISMLLAIVGSSHWSLKVEEVIRFFQHHPELMLASVTAGIQGVAASFGLPVWLVTLIATVLSRGLAADAIGQLILSLLPGAIASRLLSYLPGGLAAGVTRRIGRSAMNRGLVALHSGMSMFHSAGGSLVSVASRVFHGLSVTLGAHPANGNSMHNPLAEFGGAYGAISYVMPIERLHIIPGRRGGMIRTDNAAYGSAATNSLMIPNEAAGYPATAIQKPTGMLEAMGMLGGLFLGRGIRPREGVGEHALARTGIS